MLQAPAGCPTIQLTLDTQRQHQVPQVKGSGLHPSASDANLEPKSLPVLTAYWLEGPMTTSLKGQREGKKGVGSSKCSKCENMGDDQALERGQMLTI